MEHNLITMRPSKKEPEIGDLFVLQPEVNKYYYGKVIKAKIDGKIGAFQGWYLIFIYNICNYENPTNISFDGIPLLVTPIVVNQQPWLKGYFMTIGKLAISEYDLSVNFGFWDVLRKKYYDINGEIMPEKPLYSGIRGLGSFGIVAKEVKRALK